MKGGGISCSAVAGLLGVLGEEKEKKKGSPLFLGLRLPQSSGGTIGV